MKKFILSVFLLLSISQQVFAHPHTFIATHLDIDFIDEKIKGVWVVWEFDEMFSSSVLLDSDLNQDGKFSAQETELVYKNAFSNLENYGYFFYQRKVDKRIPAQKVENFSVRKKNQKLVYKFFVPLEASDNELVVSIMDPSFFCATGYVQQNPVGFLNCEKVLPTYKIVKNTKYPIYYNPMGAVDDQTLYTEWKKGLQTAYPEEVIISFKKKQ